ncbi:hypothetical protein SUDANB67_03055 [Nocardiopsis dassonvillei]
MGNVWPEKAQKALVNLLVSRQQQHLVARLREIPFNQVFPMLAVETSQRSVDDAWESIASDSSNSPKERNREQLPFSGTEPCWLNRVSVFADEDDVILFGVDAQVFY